MSRKTAARVIFILMLSCAAFQAATTSLFAQEAGYFFIERPQLGLGASYKLEEENRQAANKETSNREQEFRESMTVATRGWMYHPNLIDYHLSLQPQWRQEMFDPSQSSPASTRDSDRNTALLTYDVGATLLRQKPLSLNFFANRKTGQIDFTNAPDSDIERDTWGARMNFSNATLPMSIALTHRESDQSGLYQWQEDRDEVQATIRHNASRSVTQLDLFHDNADRTTRTSFGNTAVALETTRTQLTNAFFFTDDNRVKLDSRIYNLQAQYNDLDQDTWIASEDLWWHHSKNLLTRYHAGYEHRTFDDSVNEETHLSAGLTHHLFDQLTTDVGLGTVINNYSGGSENLYQTNLGLLYRRPIPWGSIELGAAYDFAVTNRSGAQNIIPTDAQLTLANGTETILPRENILLDSIVVTDLSGSVVYVETLDYRIDVAGPDVRISRTLSGAIADGQQVMVRYSYRLDAGYDDSRFGQNYHLSLALWSFVYLTYSHERHTQHIESGEPPYDPLDDTVNTVRLSFVSKWSETRFLYRQQDRSNDNSSTVGSVAQLINLRLARNLLLNFSGSIGARNYPDRDEDEFFYSIGTTMGWTPTWWCHVSLLGQRETVSKNHRQDAVYSQIAATVKLTYGVWSASASYRLIDQQDRQPGESLWRQEIICMVNRQLW